MSRSEQDKDTSGPTLVPPPALASGARRTWDRDLKNAAARQLELPNIHR